MRRDRTCAIHSVIQEVSRLERLVSAMQGQFPVLTYLVLDYFPVRRPSALALPVGRYYGGYRRHCGKGRGVSIGGRGVGSATGEVAGDTLGQAEVRGQEVPVMASHLSLMHGRASLRWRW